MVKFINFEVYKFAFKQALCKLSPWRLTENPVLLLVWAIGFITLCLSIAHLMGFGHDDAPIWFGISISGFIWLIIIVSNFVESIASYNEEKLGHLFFCSDQQHLVRKIDNEVETMTIVSNINMGNIIEVRAGETIPCEGVVISGTALVDEAAITGESAPVIRDTREGRNVVQAGTKVISDSIRIKIVNELSKSVVAKIHERISKSERRTSENSRSLTTLIFVYSLLYIVMCFGIYIIAKALNLSITIIELSGLLVCIMPTTIAGLISPIGISAIERLMKRNLIPYTPQAIELAGDVDIIIFDKTGTITEGNRKATRLQSFISDEAAFYEALELASLNDDTVEGKSILELLNKGSSFKPISLIQSKYSHIPFSATTKISGCNYRGDRYLKGSIDAIRLEMQRQGEEFPKAAQEFCRAAGMNGATPILLMKNDRVLGGIELSDKIKPGIAPRISRLNQMGYRVVMLTGDNFYTSKTIAESIGIKDFVCEADPERKLDYVRKLQDEGNIVAFIGDGTNDATSISSAEVGLVMSKAPTVSIEAANVVDFDNDPTKIIDLIEIGRETLMTRGCLTTFSFVSEFSKYLIVVPVMFTPALGDQINILNLHSPYSAITSSVIFNTLILLMMMPLALKGVKYRPLRSIKLVKRFFAVFGVSGLILPIIGIKLIDMLLVSLGNL